MDGYVTGAITRGYSLLTVKSFDDEQRLISGVASTPSVDRVGDVVVSRGAKFRNPLPLLLYHDNTKPVGTVKLATPSDDGIEFTASLPDIDEPGPLRDRVREAWLSIKAGLVRGVSIGFRPFENGIEPMKSGGLKFKDFEVLELSLVAIPANSEATIHTIKQYDTAPAASGTGVGVTRSSAGVSAQPHQRKDAKAMTVQEQIKSFEATRQAKSARMTELMTKSAEEGRTLDASESEEYDGLETEVKGIDQHLVRLEALEQANKAAARPVNGSEPAAAAASRTGSNGHPVITVRDNLPPGIGFARAVKARVVARLDQRNWLEVAKEMYPNDDRLHTHVKAAVPAGTTTQTVWAAPLVDPTNLAGEFIEYLRPATIIGKLNLRRVPFNVRMIEQTGGGTGYWVGQGAPKPLTSFAFEAVTMAFTKVAAISVITEELARFSTPSAEMLVRDGLRDALVERIDRDFIDPAEAGTANVQPASITNGLTALTSAGTSADNARTDLANLMEAFVQANLNPDGVVLIMPTTLALALSFQVNSLGQPEFPGLNMNGGTLNGIPVITSQYAANASGGGNLVIALNQREIFLADDGAVTVDASREATLQMLDNPTNNSATGVATTGVSMWQTNSIALRAERFINWAKRRDDAVVYMDDVNWGAIGSPA